MGKGSLWCGSRGESGILGEVGSSSKKTKIPKFLLKNWSSGKIVDLCRKPQAFGKFSYISFIWVDSRREFFKGFNFELRQELENR